jgi:DNA invertase Pin-like site-specific DNA recombinase
MTTTDSTPRIQPVQSAKVTDAHQAKLAVVYVRQSTQRQVLDHPESRERQYALADHAVALGWPKERVLVIDEDQGQSGKSADNRLGFHRLLAEVMMDHVGLVLGLEMSRLARSSKDWHHLLELSAVFGSLLADQDGVYDPNDTNDRLLLGLKGTMSEFELCIMRNRLERGKLNKARRGELIINAPIGYVKTPAGGLALDPDDQVRTVVRVIFDKFEELGAAHAVTRYLRQNHIRLGIRPHDGPNRGNLEWRPALVSTVYRILANPVYAGTYAYGRTPVEPKRRRRNGQPGIRHAPMAEWKVTLHDRLPAYITWEQYVRNAARLRQNRTTATTRGTARQGIALLTGLVFCGRCGRRKGVLYSTTSRPRYECVTHLQPGEARTCPGINAEVLDACVGEQVLRVLTPAGIELSLTAAGDIERERGRLDEHWRAELERAGYEARLAERSYRAVDPENRLVARTLELQWEDALRHEQEVREGYDRFCRESPRRLTPQELERIRALAADIPSLWNAADTPAADRKEIVRALLERVTVTMPGDAENVVVRIRWIGGTSNEHVLRRPISRYERLTSFPRMRKLVEAAVAAGETTTQIADCLDREGFRPPSSRADRFTPDRARDLVYRLGLSQRRRPNESLAVDEWWIRDLADELGVGYNRFKEWAKKGYVHVRRVGSRKHLVIWADAEERERLCRLRDDFRPGRTSRYPAELTRPKARPEQKRGRSAKDSHVEINNSPSQ